ncbi:diguanylate cyclase [Marinobacter sp. V034]|uniref:diguanylate cyclase n=1 Tax=Marinobacter sp. V034 TaxID=3459610 RepID=UPI0040440C21
MNQSDWQEERYTLQRLLVRATLFAEGLDGELDRLLDGIRDELRGESGNLVNLKRAQAGLDKALVRLDARKVDDQAHLVESLSRLLAAIDETAGDRLARKDIRQLDKALGKLEDGVRPLNTWLAGLTGLVESCAPAEGQAKPSWRRLFSRDKDTAATPPALDAESRDADDADIRNSSAVNSPASPEPAAAAPNQTGAQDDSSGDDRLRIARRIGELIGHMLAQVSLESSMQAKAQHLKSLLDQSQDWDTIRDALNDILDLVVAAMSQGRSEFEDFLKRLDERLLALKENCAAQLEANADRRSATELLDRELNTRLQSIGDAVDTSSSLNDLKASVSDHIQALAESFSRYREGEGQREQVLQEKLAAMQEKLAGMEVYSEQVQDQLKAERSRALTDALTQLPNRESWQQRLEFEYERWARYRNPVTMAVVDIDFFKKVNDSYGHKAGDRVIQLVAKTLKDRLRSTDFVARYGGEEFVVLMPETEIDVGYRVLDGLRTHVAELPFHFHSTPVHITLSAGMAAFGAANTVDEIFDLADKALYKAKHAGRNQVVRA